MDIISNLLGESGDWVETPNKNHYSRLVPENEINSELKRNYQAMRRQLLRLKRSKHASIKAILSDDGSKSALVLCLPSDKGSGCNLILSETKGLNHMLLTQDVCESAGALFNLMGVKFNLL